MIPLPDTRNHLDRQCNGCTRSHHRLLSPHTRRLHSREQTLIQCDYRTSDILLGLLLKYESCSLLKDSPKCNALISRCQYLKVRISKVSAASFMVLGCSNISFRIPPLDQEGLQGPIQLSGMSPLWHRVVELVKRYTPRVFRLIVPFSLLAL